MLLKTSDRTAREVITHLDDEVWNNIAEKAISKMPKYKLTNQSEIMFDDFANLTSNGYIKSAGQILEQCQLVTTFKENMIIGTSKLEYSPSSKKAIDSMPHPIAQQKKNNKRLASATQLNHEKGEKDKKSHLFRLTMTDLPNLQEQKVADTLRTAKYDNIRYNQSLQQSEKERRAVSEHRSIMEQKKFKEMKKFTYDYEGKLISLGNQKNPNAKINVVNMKPNFGHNNVKTLKNSYQKFTKQQNILEILNKRVVGSRTPAIEFPKQSEKDKQQRGSRHIKLSQQTPNMLEYLKEQDKVQTGVTITDINNKSKFYGKDRDPNEIKNAKHTEFRGEFRQLQKFRDKLVFKKLKLREPPQSQPTAIRTQYKTQYIESVYHQKVRTQVTDNKESRIFTAATGSSKKRGRIDIKNQRLYTQNFIQDLD